MKFPPSARLFAGILLSACGIAAAQPIVSSQPATAGNEPVKDSAFVGINHATGSNTRPEFVKQSIEVTRTLGLGSVRMGIDGVGGNKVNQPFKWDRRDAAVDAYLAQGLEVRAVISPRAHVHREADFAEWQAHWAYFVKSVMERYAGRIRYYIIDNEPEMNFGQGTLTAQQAVAFTRTAYQIAQRTDPSIRIESPPVTSPESDMLRQMLGAGLAQYCDYIGIHIYGSQIDDGRADKPWRVMRAMGVFKPVSASEAGVTWRWAVKLFGDGKFPGGNQAWRERWLPQHYLSMKSNGYSHTMLFTLTRGENTWQFFGDDFTPVHEPTVRQIQRGFFISPLTNGGFEEPDDDQHGWRVYFSPDQLDPTPGMDLHHPNDAASGKFCAVFKTDAAGGKPQIARRIVGQLVPGATYAVDARVHVRGSARATLSLRGYDRRAGDTAVISTAFPAGGWPRLMAQAVPTQPWMVIELRADPTAPGGGQVRWDDISVTQVALAPPSAPVAVCGVRGENEVNLRWQGSPSASHFVVRRGPTENGPWTTVFREVTGMPFTDTTVESGNRYYYTVAGVNSAGEGSACAPIAVPTDTTPGLADGGSTPAGTAAQQPGQK